MPSIRSRLHELFGPERVEIPENSATLVAQGAAWIANDEQTLVLEKPIELEMATGSRLPLLHAGTPMPSDGQLRREQFHLLLHRPHRRDCQVRDRHPKPSFGQPPGE